MKRTSRYLKLLQRVPFAESGYKERYFENSKFLQRNRITPWSCIPTALIGNAETMMGAPITAPEYKENPYVLRFSRTYKGSCRETGINQGGTTKRNALVLIVYYSYGWGLFLFTIIESLRSVLSVRVWLYRVIFWDTLIYCHLIFCRNRRRL